MAKYKKLPKRPKQSSSLEVWKAYEDKVKDVQKYNAQIDAEKKAKANIQKKLKGAKAHK
ncbi:hypothetical protein [Siphonobacter aquaeclarae]|uniref:Uncharacterized protein n=1 Tax=Siphonobacter aquaeclarae TaxID=563176 RepID=A0A1G9T9N5_9BACT|nr:hypothetical protein [Siphonobacter aquaeclarae]SDM44354.1 hypothetical protein SAMN04488090_3471 [Siphonobacter aquaeclarae]